MYADSIDKIVTSYFAAITAAPFTYKDQRYAVPQLTVSPGLLRGYTCPAGCGGCCPRFTLDYLPTELHPYPLSLRRVAFDGRSVVVYTDEQRGNRTDRCRNLERGTGRCGIYQRRPFSCDFELIRVHRGEGTAHLTQRLFSRGWNMKRTDGGRGAKCEITPVDPQTVDEVRRKLGRLAQWAAHFGLPTRLPAVLAWIDQVAASPLPPEAHNSLILPATQEVPA